MSAVTPVLREVPMDWVGIVESALHAVHYTPSASVSAALATLNSYSHAPISLYANPTSGRRDAMVFASLLSALDRQVSAWPASLCHRVRASPATHGVFSLGCHRPRVEAILALYNAAVANLQAGFAASHRVRADAAKSGQVHKMGSHTASSSMNAKVAYHHFATALQLAQAAEDALGAPEVMDLPRPLTVAERGEVQACLDVCGLHKFAAVCAAIAKYVFSIFSSVVARNPSTLSSLAFAAGSLPMPDGHGDTTLRYLSRLMLVAYHRHKAEAYYNADPRLPAISDALGHIEYADALLKELEDDCRHHHPHERSSSSSNGISGWASTLWSRLIGADPASHPQQDGEEEEDLLEEADRAQTSCAYVTLLKCLDGSDAATVFPLVATLLPQVYLLRRKYRHENRIVHFSKAVPLDLVRLDVPEVSLTPPVASAEERLSEKLASSVDASAFQDLPSLVVLEALVAQQAASKATRTSLKEKTAALLDSVAQLQGVKLPDEVEAAIDTLAPCLEDHTGSVAAALNVAKDAVEQAWAYYVGVTQQWAATRVRHTGEAHVDPPTGTEALQRDVDSWMRREASAAIAWVREVGPLDFGRDMQALRQILLPELSEVLALVSRATVHAQASANMSAEADTYAVMTNLRRTEELLEECTHMLSRQRALCHPSRWAARITAMRDVALVIWDSPDLFGQLQSASTALNEERLRVVTIPHGVLDSNFFRDSRSAVPPRKGAVPKAKAAPKNGAAAGTKRQRSPSPPGSAEEPSMGSSGLATPTSPSADEAKVGQPTKVAASLLATIRANRRIANRQAPPESAVVTAAQRKPGAKKAAPKRK